MEIKWGINLAFGFKLFVHLATEIHNLKIQPWESVLWRPKIFNRISLVSNAHYQIQIPDSPLVFIINHVSWDARSCLLLLHGMRGKELVELAGVG